MNDDHMNVRHVDDWLTYAQAAERLSLETLKAQPAGAEQRASDEEPKTAQAIAAFDSLAQRLEAMAAAKRPLWWRWLRFAD